MQETKKIFIISFNQLSTDFWKEHLSIDNSNYWHWKSPEIAMQNITTVWPDLIIIDGYWSKIPFKAYVKEVLNIRSSIEVFCLAPNTASLFNQNYLHPRLHLSRFDQSILKKINQNINPTICLPTVKQIA